MTRPALSLRQAAPGRRSPVPMGSPYARVQRPVPVGPSAIPIGLRGPGAVVWGPLPRAAARPGHSAPRTGFGLPSLRRNVCPHFYMTGIRGPVPIQAPHLLKALVRQEQTISRCQLRGGVHMEQGYVNDVCLGSRFNQCVFYEDDLDQ